MNSTIRLACFTAISIALCSKYIHFATAVMRNRVAFEKVICVSAPSSGAVIDKCVVKATSRDSISVDAKATLKRILDTIFVHYIAFFQHSTNEYRQIGLNGWEDFCGYMNGDFKNVLLTGIFPYLVQFTNANHTCPYEPGHFYAIIKNISLSSLDIPYLIPSGRFRLEISAHEGFKGPLLGKVKIFVAVSDVRIETFGIF